MQDRDLMLAQLADMFEAEGDPRAGQLRKLTEPRAADAVRTVEELAALTADRLIAFAGQELAKHINPHSTIRLDNSGILDGYEINWINPPEFRVEDFFVENPGPTVRRQEIQRAPVQRLSVAIDWRYAVTGHRVLLSDRRAAVTPRGW